MPFRRTSIAAALAGGLLLAATPALAAPGPAPGSAPLPLDHGFGTAGVQTVTAELNHGSDMLTQPDGKVLLSGTVGVPRTFGVLRLRPDGTADTTFGSAGMATLNPGAVPVDVGAATIALQSDGRIVVAAPTTWEAGSQRWVIARALPNGQPDLSFSGDGRLTVGFALPTFYTPIARTVVDAQGRITVVGSANGHLLAARLLPDGSLDRAFGTEGRVEQPLPGQNGQVADAAIDTTGRVLVGGYAGVPDTGGDMLAGRLQVSGAPDPTFGVGGFALVDSGLGFDSVNAVAVDDQDRFLMAGSFGRSPDIDRPGLVRLLPSGAPDPSFGTYGRLVVPDGRESDSHSLTGVAALPDRRIAVLSDYIPTYGSSEPYGKSSIAAVLTESGSLDPTFDGEDGVGVLPNHMVAASSLTADAQGRLLVSTTDRVTRMRTTTVTTAMSLAMAADRNPAGPGPLTVTATVTNAGPVASAAVLTLTPSKSVVVRASSGGSCSVDQIGRVVCKLRSMAVGASATVQLRTTVDGFEGTIFVSGDLASSVPDPDTADNTALLEVLTSTDVTE